MPRNLFQYAIFAQWCDFNYRWNRQPFKFDQATRVVRVDVNDFEAAQQFIETESDEAKAERGIGNIKGLVIWCNGQHGGHGIGIVAAAQLLVIFPAKFPMGFARNS